MGFQAGHEKRGGRRPGTPNKVGREARELARGLLGDPEYLSSLKTRLARGQAPRVELDLWELAYGRPRAALDNAPEGDFWFRGGATLVVDLEHVHLLIFPSGQGRIIVRSAPAARIFHDPSKSIARCLAE